MSQHAPVAARPQLGDRCDRCSALVRPQQRAQGVGRADRTARLLELEARVIARQLELPDALAALGPAAQRDARARERAVGRVVVDGREDARLERLAAEVRELPAGRRLELLLVFDGRAHPAPKTILDVRRHNIVTAPKQHGSQSPPATLR